MANVSIDGLATVLANLDAAMTELEDKADNAVHDAGDSCLNKAQARAAVRTGQMRDTMTVKHSRLSSEVATNVAHSKYNEFGTYKMPARPFLGPSADEAMIELQTALQGIL